MADLDVSMWFDRGTALYLAALALAIGLVNFYRTFRMFKVDKRTRIAVEALVANNQLSQLDATLKLHEQEWSTIAARTISDAIRAECENALHDIHRITDRNDKLRELLDAVEHSLDSIPSALVSYSLLEKTHQEFLNLRDCISGEIEQVEEHGRRLDRAKAEVDAMASQHTPAATAAGLNGSQIVVPLLHGAAASAGRALGSQAATTRYGA